MLIKITHSLILKKYFISIVSGMLLTLFATVNASAQDTSINVSLNPEEQNLIKNAPIGYDIGLTTEELKWLSENKIIKVASERDTFPYEFIDLNGNISGIAGDYLNEISERLNIEFVWAKNDNWDDGLLKIKDHEIEMVATITPTKSREELFRFTETYSKSPQAIFSSREREQFPTMESLNGHRIAQVKSTVQIEYLRKDYPDIEIIETTDYAEIFQFLSAGKADAFLGDMESTNRLTSMLFIENIIATGVSPYTIDNAMGIRNDLTFLASSIQKALADIGPISRQEILTRWQHVRIEAKLDYGPINYVIGLAVFMALLFFLWYRKLSFAYTALNTETAERKLAEEKLRQAQKMEAVGQLTGGIAHDFNNILAIIMGNLELAQLEASGHKNILSSINRALEGASRGTGLIDNLLGFSRVHTSETTLTSLNQSVESMSDLLVKSLTASIEVETELDANLWSVNVDVGDLEDAILNLALNARDAMPDGGRLSIETANKVLDADFVRSQPEARLGEYAMLSVSDTGIGMLPEIREQVLEPFFTTKPEGQGTGLGLSMVYGFVKRSDGFITVVSEPDAGTSIKLFLPRERREALRDTLTTDKEELPRGDETVLVVDDEEELVKLAVANLESLGYTVLTALDGESALALIKDKPNIDLLFSDVVMPGELDGYLLSIAAKKANPALKILLTSGFTKRNKDYASADRPMFEELTRSLLRKPYNRSELATAIRNALD